MKTQFTIHEDIVMIIRFHYLFAVILFVTIVSADVFNNHDISKSSESEIKKMDELLQIIEKNEERMLNRLSKEQTETLNDNVYQKSVRQKRSSDTIQQPAMLEISKNGGIENNLASIEIQGRKTIKEAFAPNTKESKTDDETDIEPREEDFIEAADFGIQAMNNLYLVKEPKLYSMGLFLSPNNPARYVAAFNEQTEEAKQLAKFGYAALEAAQKFRSKFPDVLRQASLRQSSEKTSLRQQCPNRGTPVCPPASIRYRTTDGSCNNHKEPWWGSAMSTMQRFLPAVYEDGIQTIRRSVTGSLLPSARQISDYIHEERDVPLVSVTHMLMQWGQFIDHDITATGQSRAFNGSVPQCCLNGGRGFQPPEFMHPECLPIAVHPDDSHLGKLDIGCLEFVRSGPAPREDCEFGAREQLSQVTSFIDASTVYSSSARQGDSLRIFRNGLMQYGKIQSRRPVLPRDDSDLCRRGSLSTSCFRAGDNRLSEQPALTSLHVVFLRLHNRIATQLAALNQHWGDEKIFQETRKLVGAIIQHITYREFLPIVLGPDVLKIFDIELLRKGYYEGYDQSVNPNIANAFSTAAYRFGHSLVQHSFVRFDRNHQPILNNVTIHEEFSNPANLETVGSVDRILLGLVNQPAQKRDEFMSRELTNHLFQTPGFPFGMDLASLNVQRGRDHGIPPFVDWRQPCSLSPIRNWKDLERIMSPETAKKFQDLYAAVEDIDLFSAGLAEKPVAGGLVGPTFACIIAQQFRALRKGDRFWYENPFIESGFSLDQLHQIRKVTLAQILCRTLDNIDTIQPFVMLAADNLRNQRLTCDDPILEQIDLGPWIEKPIQQRVSSNSAEAISKDEEELSDDEDETESRNAPMKKKSNQRFAQRPKPVKSKINQQNRIVVKRPLGPHENLTIVVHNHAINSPVFVKDSIYGSSFQINQFPNSGSSSFRPQQDYQKPTGESSYVHRPMQRPYNHQFSPVNPYFPHNLNDPNNPNPVNYGFNIKPPNNYFSNNEYYTSNVPNTPQSEQNYFNEYQQEPYYTTKKYRPTQSSTTKSPYFDYNQESENNYSTKPETSDYQNNRPYESSYLSQTDIKDPYSNFEPNNSDRDEFNPNYRPTPTRKPKPSPQSNSNGYQARPTTSSKRPSYGSNQYSGSVSEFSNSNYQTKRTTSRPQTEKPNRWQSTPQSPYFPNNNFQKEEIEREMPNYLHTHTTFSTIHYAPTKPQKHKYKVDLELPRPLSTVQSRESEDLEIDKLTNKSLTNTNLLSKSNLTKNNVDTKKFNEKENANLNTNSDFIEEKSKLTTLSTTMLDNLELTTQMTLKNISRVTNRKTILSSTPKIPLETKIENEFSYDELPRPIKLKPGS